MQLFIFIIITIHSACNYEYKQTQGTRKQNNIQRHITANAIKRNIVSREKTVNISRGAQIVYANKCGI